MPATPPAHAAAAPRFGLTDPDPAGFSLDEIRAVFTRFWKTGYGSVAADEAQFIQSLIARHRPRHFLEIGMASGLSGGLISLFLDRFGGAKFTSIDHDNTFFGDKTKQNGFLIHEVYPGNAITVTKRPFTTALNLDAVGDTYDMAFVDANHQHPWPMMDTLCLYPHLTGSRIVIHHDLRLFRKQDVVFGIGPKYLFDQFPDSHRLRSTANQGNIFAVSLDMDQNRLEAIAADAFALPWSLRTPMTETYLDAFRKVLAAHYSPAMQQAFDAAARKFNVMDRFRTGL